MTSGPEHCAACGRSLVDAIVHHTWDGTTSRHYCPGHCPGKDCTTTPKASQH